MLVLAVSDLHKTHAGRPILRGVTLALQARERVALLGPSGCGKTTLLNCIGGIDRADRGEVKLAGINLPGLSGDALAEIRRSQLGSIFQFFHLLPTMTAWENVELPLRLQGMPAEERAHRVRCLMDRVGILARSGALPGELSGGEMQRVAIARALVHRPGLILADEPTGNLDSATGSQVLDLLREVSDEEGTALLMVTHSAEAAQLCHRVLRMKDGVLEDA